MRLFNSGRYAAVTSTLALVVALGGVSYAAVVVTGTQIKDNTVTTKDIKNKTIKTKDISAAAKDALQGQVGPAGKVGPSGQVGPAGPSKVYSVSNNTDTWLTGTTKEVLTQEVPPGSYTVSSKVTISQNNGDQQVFCILAGGGTSDESGVWTTWHPSTPSYSTLYDQIAFTSTTNATLTLGCRVDADFSPNTRLIDKKLTAIQVGSVTALTGPDVP